jgi:hypothetical protein
VKYLRKLKLQNGVIKHIVILPRDVEVVEDIENVNVLVEDSNDGTVSP